MRALLAALLLATLFGCSSSSSPAESPATEPPVSWIGMDPGDARTFSGPGGGIVLLVADETYSIDGSYASALTWKHGQDYTTDYWVQDHDGSVRWYGRKGAWRAGRHGEQPREVPLDDGVARFGDRTITLGEDGPVRLQTPDGVYTP